MGKNEEELSSKARNTVYRLLQFRLRSENEIHEKLKAKHLPVSVIDQTIRYFKEIALIDDRRFAKAWTASRLKKPFGINRIRLELKKKGIDPAIIEATLNEAAENYEELDIVTELARHRSLKYENISPEKKRQRIYGYLQRRGFNTNIIIKAIKNL